MKFQWEQATILEIERYVNRRRLLEAIHIYENKDIAMNVYSGKSDIPKSWFPIFDKLDLASWIGLKEVMEFVVAILIRQYYVKMLVCFLIIFNFTFTDNILQIGNEEESKDSKHICGVQI